MTPPSRRTALALLALSLLAAGLALDLGWLVTAVVLAIVVVAFVYAARFLLEGQTEWFAREERRKEERARRR